jgi:hypothetical protein
MSPSYERDIFFTIYLSVAILAILKSLYLYLIIEGTESQDGDDFNCSGLKQEKTPQHRPQLRRV